MVRGGYVYDNYQGNHFVSYIISNHYAVHLKHNKNEIKPFLKQSYKEDTQHTDNNNVIIDCCLFIRNNEEQKTESDTFIVLKENYEFKISYSEKKAFKT